MHLSEAVSLAQFKKTSELIKRYLKNQLGTQKVYIFPEPEHFKVGGRTGVGIRYFINSIESLRLNWVSEGSIDSSKNLMSVDYWDGSRFDGRPSYHMAFDHNESLVKTLPLIVNFVKIPIIGKTLWIEDDPSLIEHTLVNINADFTTLTEARAAGGNALVTIQNVLRALSEGIQPTTIYNTEAHGPGRYKIVVAIRNLYPDFFEKKGNSTVLIDPAYVKKMDINKITSALGVGNVGATVTVGSPESIVSSTAVDTMEENLPRLCFEEQLEDLKRAMVLLMNNATQSMYVAGRGGCLAPATEINLQIATPTSVVI